MLINSKELLDKAKHNKQAILQFNVNNLEWARYILETAEEEKKSIILGFSEGAIRYIGGYKTVVNIINSLIEELNITVNIVLHLDHGNTVESCIKAIDSGFTSVMYDGSKLSLKENIENTKKIVFYANQKNVSVEGELGKLGTHENKLSYTNLEDAIYYVKETKIDSLAPSVGNMHGIYKELPNINYELINKLSKNISIPLVLHGGSGLSSEDFIKCVEAGITKININTQLQIAWANALRKYLNDNLDVYDPRKIISSGQNAIKNTIRKYFNIFYC